MFCSFCCYQQGALLHYPLVNGKPTITDLKGLVKILNKLFLKPEGQSYASSTDRIAPGAPVFAEGALKEMLQDAGSADQVLN